MDRGTFLGYLPPLGKFSDKLRRVGWEALGDQWRSMVSRKTHKGCTVRCRVLGELKNWILEQPVNNKGCSSIQLLLREFNISSMSIKMFYHRVYLGHESPSPFSLLTWFRFIWRLLINWPAYKRCYEYY